MTTEQKETYSRDDLRKVIFSTRQLKRVPATLNNMQLEIKQPTIAQVMEIHEEDSNHRFARMLIQYCYVPGTEERVFEDADLEQIIELPHTAETMRIQEIITNFLIGDVKAAEKN